MTDQTADQFTAEQINKLAKLSAALKQEWDTNQSVRVDLLSIIESTVGKLNRRLFSGR